MTDIALDEKALAAARKAGDDAYMASEENAVDDAIVAAIRAYLRSSPSQVAPQPQAGEAVAWLMRSNWGENTWAQLTPDIAEADRNYVKITPRYASPQPANPAQVTDAVEKLRRQVEAANPNHKTMFVYVDDLRTALAANPAHEVGEVADAIARLLTYGEPKNDPKGTLFRFDNGARFFLSAKDVDTVTAAIGAGGQAVGAEAENARLRALPLKDEVERVLEPEGEPVTLDACPIGLFEADGGELCLKTEYGSNEGRIDAYIVSSGEFFWGGAVRPADQREVTVQPVAARSLLSRLRAGEQEGWRSIDSVPKDGTHVLARASNSPEQPPTTVHYFDGGWHLSVNALGDYSDHGCADLDLWCPLPAAPSELGGDRDANR